MREDSSDLRSMAVASVFYPEETLVLKEELALMLDRAEVYKGGRPKALIVPHAAYIYSGDMAALAYKSLIPYKKEVKRVVLIGPAHREYLRGVALSSASFFETPFYNIPLDTEENKKLLEKFLWVGISDSAHLKEHALEVQLPFLCELLDDFSLLPLIVGELSAERVAELIEYLWGDKDSLLIISSDLSHFHDYETAEKKDRKTAEAIEEMDVDALYLDNACGFYPLRGFLLAARKKNLKVHSLGLSNSGDVSGDKSRVVGYGAWVFSEEG